MMSKLNTVLNIKSYAMMEIFDKKSTLNFRLFSSDQYHLHIMYFELCIALAQKNRMGLLNITKNLTFD